MAFALGYVLSAGVRGRSSTNIEQQQPILLRCFWICTGLTCFAYMIWLAVGVKNGFRPGMILDFINMNNSKLETFEFKERIFPTVPGITTLTQCGMIAVMLGLLPCLRSKPYVKITIAMIIAAAFLRGMMLSERLALIELVVTMGIVFLRTDVLGKLRSLALKLGLRVAPIVGPVLLLVLFGSFEYFRSYRHYQDRFNNIAEFTIWRVSAYYTLGHNNSALVMEKRGVWPLPFTTLSAVWTFPLVRHSPFSYAKLTGIEPDKAYNQLLRMHGVPEYNNEGGLFAPLMDYGIFGFAIYWCGAGFLCGVAYRAYLAGSTVGLCFYPLLYLSLLETPRYIYVCLSRATPQILIILFLWYLFTQRSTRQTVPALDCPSSGAESPA